MKYVTLNNGVKMPQLGFGTYQIDDKDVCINSVLTALKLGYRLIDTAQFYQNEQYIGEAIRKSGIAREEIFITTKIDFHYNHKCEEVLLESFKKLNVDYIDMVMIHWPYNDYYHAYKVLEKYYKLGKIRAIGISNFEPGRLVDVMKFMEIKPQVNQIEANYCCQRKIEQKWNDRFDIVTQAYCPLGQNSIEDFYTNPIMVNIAKAHDKSVAQIAIRFLLHLGMSVIPKSIHEKRIKENYKAFDFDLSDEEIEQIKSLDKNQPLIGKSENPDAALEIIG